jgi:hypothetical protein
VPYGRDVLADDGRHRRPPPEVTARRGMLLEVLGDSFVGQVVGARGQAVVLEDRRGRRRAFDTRGAGFMLDDRLVRLRLPERAPSAPAGPRTTASGSVAVEHTVRQARASRIFVEGIHDAELLEKIWGDDLRVEGIVVEVLDGVDDLDAVIRAFAPGPGRRMGVLVDHLVPGSKESRVAATVRDPHVLVTGHPFVDVWAAVRPSLVGLDAWPEVPRDRPWKDGICEALGEPEPGVLWKRILGSVRAYTDLDRSLVGAVERLIDFLTEPEA